jgi:nucleotide-binding universal stress UspA family protein
VGATLLAVETIDEAAGVALARAQAFALLRGGGLCILRVCPPGTAAVEVFCAEQELRKQCRRQLEESLGSDRLVVCAGDFTDEVKRASSTCGADLIVIAADGTAAERAARIARQTSLPVLVARPPRTEGTLVAATDLARPKYPVVRQVAELAARLDAQAVLLHSAADPDGVGRQHELLKTVATSLAPGAELLVTRDGDPLEAILAAERRYDCDLTVVGATVGSKPDLVAPSLAEEVVRNAKGSVLITPVE